MSNLLTDDAVVRRIAEAAAAAPSMHNSQPWHVAVGRGDMLELRADLDRALLVADPQSRGLHLSCGAALFNIRMAIRMAGHNPLVWPLPCPSESPAVLAIVRAEQARPATFTERELYDAIWRRHTSRGPYADLLVPDSVQVAIEQAASSEFASLRMLTITETAATLTLAASADRTLATDFDHQVELGRWIASGSDEDGIPATSLAPEPDHDPAPVRDLSSVVPTVPRPAASYELHPQLAVLTTARDEPADRFRAGQALQRLLLTATVHGVSASFLYQPIELRDMRGDAAPDWPWEEHPQMIIRFGYGHESAPTPRRRLDDVLIRIADSGTGH